MNWNSVQKAPMMTTGMLSTKASLIADRTLLDCILPAKARRPFIKPSFII